MAPEIVDTKKMLENYHLVENLQKREITVTLRFEAVTPVWTGDYQGNTIEVIKKNGAIAGYLFNYPNAQAIIGRARWLLRGIGPCVRDTRKGGEKERGELNCDKIGSELFGELGHAGSVRVSVQVEKVVDKPLINYDIIRLLKKILNMADRLYIKPVGPRGNRIIIQDRSMRKILGKTSVYSALAYVGFRKLRGRLDPKENHRRRGRIGWKIRCLLSKIPELNLSIPEDKNGLCNKIADEMKKLLSTEGIDNLLYLLTIPRFLLLAMGRDAEELFRIQPLPPGHVLRVSVSGRNLRDVAVAAASIATVMVLFGVGKAVTRGFGRYKLENYYINGFGVDKQIDILEHLKILYNKNKDELKKLIKNILNILRKMIDTSNGPQTSVLFPRLDIVDVYVGHARHPAPYHIEELGNIRLADPFDCNNILDQNTKLMCALSGIGAAFLKSTWKAWLIKQGEELAIIKKLRRPGTDLHTWPLGLPRGSYKGNKNSWTGYIFDNDIDSDCYEKLLNPEIPRMQSPVTVFPIGDYIVMIVPRVTELMDYVLQPGEERKRKALLHVGKHRDREPRRIKVKAIIENEDVPAEDCDWTKDPDPGGVMPPKDNNYDNIITGNDVFKVSVDWVRVLLGLG